MIIFRPVYMLIITLTALFGVSSFCWVFSKPSDNTTYATPAEVSINIPPSLPLIKMLPDQLYDTVKQTNSFAFVFAHSNKCVNCQYFYSNFSNIEENSFYKKHFINTEFDTNTPELLYFDKLFQLENNSKLFYMNRLGFFQICYIMPNNTIDLKNLAENFTYINDRQNADTLAVYGNMRTRFINNTLSQNDLRNFLYLSYKLGQSYRKPAEMYFQSLTEQQIYQANNVNLFWKIAINPEAFDFNQLLQYQEIYKLTAALPPEAVNDAIILSLYNGTMLAAMNPQKTAFWSDIKGHLESIPMEQRQNEIKFCLTAEYYRLTKDWLKFAQLNEAYLNIVKDDPRLLHDISAIFYNNLKFNRSSFRPKYLRKAFEWTKQALDRAGTGSYYAITAAKIAIELRDYEAETFDMLDKALKYAEDNKDDDKVKIVEDLRQQFYEVLSIPR